MIVVHCSNCNSQVRTDSFCPICASSADFQTPCINLNTATAEELITLPRIGRKTAERIVKLRNLMGVFQFISDLLLVQGLGPITIKKFKHLIYINQ